MAIHSSILAWRIPWMEEPGVHGATKSLHFHFQLIERPAYGKLEVNPFHVLEIHCQLCLRPQPWAN